jgi:hypothetical protein
MALLYQSTKRKEKLKVRRATVTQVLKRKLGNLKRNERQAPTCTNLAKLVLLERSIQKG